MTLREVVSSLRHPISLDRAAQVTRQCSTASPQSHWRSGRATDAAFQQAAWLRNWQQCGSISTPHR